MLEKRCATYITEIIDTHPNKQCRVINMWIVVDYSWETVIVILLQKRGDWQRLGSCADLLKENMNKCFLGPNCLGNVLLMHNHYVGAGEFGGRVTAHFLSMKSETKRFTPAVWFLKPPNHLAFNFSHGQDRSTWSHVHSDGQMVRSRHLPKKTAKMCNSEEFHHQNRFFINVILLAWSHQ